MVSSSSSRTNTHITATYVYLFYGVVSGPFLSRTIQRKAFCLTSYEPRISRHRRDSALTSSHILTCKISALLNDVINL